MKEIAIPEYENAFLRSSAEFPDSIETSADMISFAMKKMDYFFGKTFEGKLIITIDPNAPGPLNAYDGVNIILHVQSNLSWCQITYQFCHEYCHHLIVSTPEISNRKWFEEIICEISSRFFLKKLSVSNLKKANYQNYKSNFNNYILDNSNTFIEIEWDLSACLEVIDPISFDLTTELLDDIQTPNRPMLSYGASKLYPVFANHPEIWKSVSLIHNFKPNVTFLENLIQWENESTDKAVGLIRNVFESN